MRARRYRPGTASRVRIAVRRFHLWLGMSLGLLFALLGLTGSALIFYTGIDAALHPAIATHANDIAPDWRSPVWDHALATGRARRASPEGSWTIELTGEPGPIPARYYPTAGHHGAREMVWFSPRGTRILRAEPWGGYVMSWIYRLHMELLAGDLGRQIVGWSGVAMLVLLASGLFAWWPRGCWSKALAFKRPAAPIRRLHDLHKLAGLAMIPLTGALVATGVLLALPAVTRALLNPVPLPTPTLSVREGSEISIARALAIGHAALPDGRPVFIDIPGASDGAIRVRYQVPGDPHRRFPGSYVFIDRHSGRVLAIRDARRGGAGNAVALWIRTIHDGTVGGLATRILALLVGLAPTFLFVTGVLHWRRRRAALISPRADRPCG